MKKVLLVLLAALFLLTCLAGCTSSALDSDTTDLDEANTAINDTTDGLSEKITNLEGKIQSLESSLATIDTQIKDLDKTSDTKLLEETKAELQEEINAVKNELKKEIESISDTFNGVSTEKITNFETKISTLEATFKTLSESVKALQEKADKNGEDITDLKDKTDKNGEDITGLKNKTDKNGEDIADLKEKIETLEAEKSELETKLNENGEDIAALLERLEALEAEKNAMQAQISCLLGGSHSWEYTDNKDGTHNKTCSLCDFSINNDTHVYFFTYKGEDMFKTITASCACGDSHSLKYDCFCYDCGKPFHDVDENCYCKNCIDTMHNVDPTNGICNHCNEFTAEASVTIDGVKTYYSIINYALLAAIETDGALVVLENNATLRYYHEDFNKGTVTLDLNGKIFDSHSNYALRLEDTCNITVKDSVGTGKFADEKMLNSGDGTIIFESGSADTVFPSTDGTLIVTGGNIKNIYNNTKTATLTLSGGTFGLVETFADYHSLADLLAEGYCYYDSDGNVVDTNSISAVDGWYKVTNVTVAPIK